MKHHALYRGVAWFTLGLHSSEAVTELSVDVGSLGHLTAHAVVILMALAYLRVWTEVPA